MLPSVAWSQKGNKSVRSNSSTAAVQDSTRYFEDVTLTSGEKMRVYKWVERMPEFPGEVRTYLNQQIIYPAEAKLNGDEGRVLIRFIVDTTGQLRDPVIFKSTGFPLLDKEALRVVSAMPPWKPATRDGRPVAAFFQLPFKFLAE